MDKDLRIKALEYQNALLTERVAELETALFESASPVRPEWCPTGSEARIFAVLVKKETALKSDLMAGLYDTGRHDPAEPKIVDVFIHKLRRKLRPFGIEIETIWGTGYRLLGREMFRREAA